MIAGPFWLLTAAFYGLGGYAIGVAIWQARETIRLGFYDLLPFPVLVGGMGLFSLAVAYVQPWAVTP